MRSLALSSLALGLFWRRAALGHPMCRDFDPPVLGVAPGFCTSVTVEPDGFCCTPGEEAAVAAEIRTALGGAGAPASARCQELHKEVRCITCDPFAAHLFEELEATMGDEGQFLCNDFCQEYVDECAGSVLELPADYCTTHSNVPDNFYCYPFTTNFSEVSAELVDAFPNLELPDRIVGMEIRPDANAWWLLDMRGQVYEIANDPAVTNDDLITIVDLEGQVMFWGEMGLIGLAFSPDFEETGLFYLNFVTGNNGPRRTQVMQFTYIPGEQWPTLDTQQLIMEFDQPDPNHNGGWMGFHPVDYIKADVLFSPNAAPRKWNLYISTGDGGGANDPNAHSQDNTKLLGKMLRVRVGEGIVGYEIPPNNPFANKKRQKADGIGGGFMEEIWATGLRNPWRCSFDNSEGTLWCADVGQNKIEEIDIIVKGGNYGWRDLEGTICNTGAGDDVDCMLDQEAPVYEYCHTGFADRRYCGYQPLEGNSITGGYVYRGKQYADVMAGSYIFADYESRVLGRLYQDKEGKWGAQALMTAAEGVPKISTFGQDHDREIYLVDHYQGKLYRLPCGAACSSTVSVASAQPGAR